MAVQFEREGARISCGDTYAAMVVRLVDNGDPAGSDNIEMEIFADRARTVPVGVIEPGTGASGNNYTATSYVTGLSPGTQYWWRAKANGTGGPIYGTSDLLCGSFKTMPVDDKRQWSVGLSGCWMGRTMGNLYLGLDRGQQVSEVHKNIMLRLKPDYLIALGDVYYGDTLADRDTGLAAYAHGKWNNLGTTLQELRENFLTTMDGALYRYNNALETEKPHYTTGHLFAAIPTMYMFDDHDLGINDISDVPNMIAPDLTTAGNGWQVSHENFMDLNRDHVNQESDRDFVTDNVSVQNCREYFYRDIGHTRFVVLELRTQRSANSDTDSASKVMMNATQLAWLKSQIDAHKNGDFKFLCICTQVQLDGDHGWFESSDDNWKEFSYQRDEWMYYIAQNGNPARTVILSSDTHNGSVAEFKYGGSPMYEFMAGNNWYSDSGRHGWQTGYAKTDRPLSGETKSPSGMGGRLLMCVTEVPTMVMVNADADSLTVSLWATYPNRGPVGDLSPKKFYSRVYR